MGGVGDFEWDDRKAASNAVKHGLKFDAVSQFDFDSAIVAEDRRGEHDPRFRYPERRLVALGLLGSQIAVLVYSPKGRKRRIISLRHAEPEECEIWLKGP